MILGWCDVVPTSSVLAVYTRRVESCGDDALQRCERYALTHAKAWRVGPEASRALLVAGRSAHTQHELVSHELAGPFGRRVQHSARNLAKNCLCLHRAACSLHCRADPPLQGRIGCTNMAQNDSSAFDILRGKPRELMTQPSVPELPPARVDTGNDNLRTTLRLLCTLKPDDQSSCGPLPAPTVAATRPCLLRGPRSQATSDGELSEGSVHQWYVSR